LRQSKHRHSFGESFALVYSVFRIFQNGQSPAKTQDAIMFNLVVLGEAANRVSEQFQAQYSSIPWASIIGTRNVIVRGYDQLKLPIVWEIIQKD